MANQISEFNMQNRLRAFAAASYDALLFRNNSGVAREETRTGAIRPIRYGLGNDSPQINAVFKSSDLIGITPCLIQSHHIGRIWGVFTGLEIKNSSWRAPRGKQDLAQMNFITEIQKRGGLAGFSISEQDYTKLLTQFLQ